MKNKSWCSISKGIQWDIDLMEFNRYIFNIGSHKEQKWCCEIVQEKTVFVHWTATFHTDYFKIKLFLYEIQISYVVTIN